MRVIIPQEKVLNKRQLIIYITIIAICIISIIVASYIQFYARIDLKRLIGIETESAYGKKSEEEIELLETRFNQIFNNSEIDGSEQNNKKEETDKPLIYTIVEKKENKTNSYDVDVHIPYININNEIAKQYNEEIKDFIKKTNNVLDSENSNIIYTVEYVGNIHNDILSVMIRSNLKEGSSAQRVIVQTYNYDLRNNKKISLEEVLKIYNLDINDTQTNINNKINIEQNKVQDLKELGYNIFNRNMDDDRYKIENTDIFYLTDNTLYIIYAYGNEAYTSEMDLVII